MENNINERLYSTFYRAGYLLKRKDAVGIPVSPAQLRLLHRISLCESISQRDLLDMIQVRPASLSNMIAKLETSGHLQRTRDLVDKRNMHICITAQGKELVEKFYFKQKDIAEQAFDCLTNEEKEKLQELLGKLVENWRPQEE